MDSLKLRILQNNNISFETPLTGLIELGRQRLGEPEPFTLLHATADHPARLVIARSVENKIPRLLVHLLPLPGGAVRVSNLSLGPLPCPGRAPCPARPSMDVPPPHVDLTPPFKLVLDGRTISVSGGDDYSDAPGFQGLENATIGPGNLSELGRLFRPLPTHLLSQTDELVGWLQTTMGVLQSAVGSADFLAKAVEALVQIVGLDSGRILLLRAEEWTAVAVHGTAAVGVWAPNHPVLNRVRREKRTIWQQPTSGAPDATNIGGLDSALASPLLNGAGEVIGALYGERRRGGPDVPNSGKLEAILVDLLACGVSTGLARQQQQLEAAKMQVQFEQFFTKELAAQLRLEPDLLEGKDAEVTLLFADIRGYSRISGRLKPALTMQWIGEVMGELSECVLREEGVVVDYIGDELMAMWGAPRPQPDQAVRAVTAALAMRDAAAAIDRRWRDRLGEPMGLGIGVNTGVARVGNTGSRHKFKYGPLGDPVNVASRTQGITKYLRCGLLVTRATKEKLEGRFTTRRVVTVHLVNIKEPVELYEVEAVGSEERRAFFRESEEALAALEKHDFAEAARRVGSLIALHPGDGPLLLTLARAAPMLMHPEGPFDPGWEPPGK